MNLRSVLARREAVHVQVDAREEVTDAVTQGRRLLFLTGKRRALAPFLQVFLTGSAVCHWMSLLCVHLLLMRSDVALLVEPVATHMARVPEDALVNRLLVTLQGLRP